MKRKLKKKELEKVSGGGESRVCPYYESKYPTYHGIKGRPDLRGTPTGSNSEQSEGNPEGLPIPQ